MTHVTQAQSGIFEQITVLLSTVDGTPVRTASAVRIALIRHQFRREGVVTRYDESGKSFVASVQFLGGASEEGSAWAGLCNELGIEAARLVPVRLNNLINQPPHCLCFTM
jgi:hypothetical protein